VPRAVVFNVWTDAEHFAQWLGPRDVVLPFCQIEPRPGGTLHFCHRLGDGLGQGVYREFVAPERLVFSLGFVDADGRPAAHPMFPDWPLDTTILTTVTFADLGGALTGCGRGAGYGRSRATGGAGGLDGNLGPPRRVCQREVVRPLRRNRPTRARARP
jgi:uncharacterized protein YndB with AHSA1/START domain